MRTRRAGLGTGCGGGDPRLRQAMATRGWAQLRAQLTRNCSANTGTRNDKSAPLVVRKCIENKINF